MRILLISPTGYEAKEDMGYGGVEKLVWQYSKELSKRHEITVVALEGSEFPDNVVLLPAKKLKPL